jgi:hypothetical protein
VFTLKQPKRNLADVPAGHGNSLQHVKGCAAVGQPYNETTHRSAAPLPCGPMGSERSKGHRDYDHHSRDRRGPLGRRRSPPAQPSWAGPKPLGATAIAMEAAPAGKSAVM